MSDSNIERNRKELKAWEAWKIICSVDGLAKDKRYGKGIEEELKREFDSLEKFKIFVPEARRILSEIIKNAFKKKIGRICHSNIDEIFKFKFAPSDDNDCENEKHGKLNAKKMDDAEKQSSDHKAKFDDLMYWANEFDSQLAIKSKDSSTANKSYKDWLWNKCENSKDPKLKIIRGKLLASRGVINEIAEKYLKVNHYEIWVNYERSRKSEDGKFLKFSCDSLDRQINDDGTVIGDVIAAPQEMTNQIGSQNLLREDLCAEFTSSEMAFILAAANRMLSNQEFLDFVQLKKSAANSYWNNTLCNKLRSDSVYYELLHTPEVLDTIKFLLTQEKSAKPFLLKVDEAN